MVEREIDSSVGVLRHPHGLEHDALDPDCPSPHHSIKDASDVQWYVGGYQRSIHRDVQAAASTVLS